MKRNKLFTLLSLGVLALGGLGLLLVKSPSRSLLVKAEDEIVDPEPQPEPEPEVFECSVVVVESQNGTVSVDKLEGHVGEEVNLNVKHDVFYLVKSVSVNGTELVEDEDISGKYSFLLVEGENKVEAKFVIDEELLGEMSVLFEQAKAKDWSNLFSVENLIRVVSFLLNGGILLAIVRYYVKDKKLEGKLENKVSDTVAKVVPEATKEIVTATIKDLIMPVFTEMKLDSEETKNALTVFSRCFALAQENTPEARIAITQELSSLKLGDQASIAAVKQQLEDFVAKQNQNFLSIMEKMQKMEQTNKNIIEQSSGSVQEEVKDETETHPYE